MSSAFLGPGHPITFPEESFAMKNLIARGLWVSVIAAAGWFITYGGRELTLGKCVPSGLAKGKRNDRKRGKKPSPVLKTHLRFQVFDSMTSKSPYFSTKLETHLARFLVGEELLPVEMWVRIKGWKNTSRARGS
jgi:hypothetical protein